MGIVLAGLVYVLVMPHLSSYFGFSILLFGLTTLIYAIFWDPRATMLKFAAIVPFIMLTGLQNAQTYDFASFANNATCMLLSMIFTAATSIIPFSLRPESMFVRLTGRFFHQADQGLAQLGPDAAKDKPQASRATIAAMQHSVGKLGGWAHNVDYRTLPDSAPHKAAALVTSLNSVTYRFKMLADAALAPQPLRDHVSANAGAWRQAIAALLRPWADGRSEPAAGATPETLRDQEARLERDLEKTLRAIPPGQGEDAYASAYRLLGSYRGLYKALLAHAALSADFDWDRWRETRL